MLNTVFEAATSFALDPAERDDVTVLCVRVLGASRDADTTTDRPANGDA